MLTDLKKNELDYKLKLIDFILDQTPTAILASEFPFNFQKRRADLLIINDNSTHAIEIKSDVDNTYTLHNQIDDYYKVFNKVSILISEKHLKNINMLNKNVGVYILKNEQILCKRQAKERRKLNKRLVLDLLSTPELKKLSAFKTNNRIELIDDIEKKISFKQLNEISYASLYKKINAIFSLFKNEKIGFTTIHDLSILEIRQPLI